ncbi:MAG: c-type cytochrome [Acidobacteria bacterium]|nr:c-type cytochrome [Acidobacteriota bacterium]
MRRYITTVVVGIVCFGLGVAFQRVADSRRVVAPPQAGEAPVSPAVAPAPIRFDREPLWAYGFDTPAKPTDTAPPQAPPTRNLRPNEDPAAQTRPRRAAGSLAEFSLVDVRDGRNVVDWFPGDHPVMPEIIVHGPAALSTTRRGCGSCHLPNGKGRPENAPVSALPVAYFIRQMQDFRSGVRHSADPRKPNTNTMIDLAKAMTDDEVTASAEYFAAIRWTPWIRVVETDKVPKTRIVGNLFLAPTHERTEPIAGRIIEVPEVLEQAELLRNPRSGFVAYVPAGSIEKGKDLVTTGGMRVVGNAIIQGTTTACVTCHGLDLMGVADVPPIAGRSPSYITRQMWDIQQGTRNGAAVQLMKQAITGLTEEDLIAIAAYVSSRVPPRVVQKN